MDKEAKPQSTARSFAILGTASIICKVLAIVYLSFQRHILGDEGNSVVANGYILFTFLFSLSNAGLPQAVSKLIAHQTALGNHKASMKILKCSYIIMLIMGIICGGVMLLGAGWIAKDFLHQNEAKLMIMWLSPTLIITSVSCAFRGYFQGRQQMKVVAVSQVLEQILNVTLTVVFAWLLVGKGLAYGAAGTTIGTLVGALGTSVFLSFLFFAVFSKQRRREIRHQKYNGPELSTQEVLKEILRYSLPAILSTIAVSAPSLIDSNSGIIRLEAAGYNHHNANIIYGIYSYQFQRLFTLSIAFSTALVTAMIPAVSSALASHDERVVNHRINESFKAIYIVTIPSIAGLMALGQPVINFVFNSLKSGGGSLIMFGLWTAILMTIQYVQSSILIAVGKPVIASVNQIVGAVFKLILNYVLISIPWININGAIIGTAVSWLISIILNQYAIRPCFSFKIHYIRMMIRPAIVSVVMGVCCYLIYEGTSWLLFKLLHFLIPYLYLSDAAVIIAVLAGICIYFALMIKIHGVNKKDIQRLPMGGRIYRYAARVPFLRRELEA